MLNFELYNYLFDVRLHRIDVIKHLMTKIRQKIQCGMATSKLRLQYINLSVELDELE